MAHVQHRFSPAQNPAATNSREYRTFLLMQQLAAKEIGSRIRQARKERGLSQEDLAAMCSFSKRSLQDYEAGVTIPYRHFTEIGRLLDKPPEWFLYGPDHEAEAEDVTPLDGDLADRLQRVEGDVREIRKLAEANDEAQDRVESLLRAIQDRLAEIGGDEAASA